jgi:hypothetical protein
MIYAQQEEEGLLCANRRTACDEQFACFAGHGERSSLLSPDAPKGNFNSIEVPA